MPPPIHDIDIDGFYEFLGIKRAATVTLDNERVPSLQKMSEGSQKEPQSPPAFRSTGDFIAMVEDFLNFLPERKIAFAAHRNHPLVDHPTTTQCKPDIVAYSVALAGSEPQPPLRWSSLEIMIKYKSTGTNKEKHINQAASYAAYLLRARPDLISTLGLLVNPDALVFLICNACGTKKLQLKDQADYEPLLKAVVKYLNNGQLGARERTLERTRDQDNGAIRFNITCQDDRTLELARLHYSTDPFGRRSHVFICDNDSNGVLVRWVVKDQYVRQNRHWMEWEILEAIHQDKPYPAVARLEFWYHVDGSRCGDCIKARMGTTDYGTNFMRLATPRQVLYAIYDLLEVTRGLYVDWGILHRDISPNNIVIRPPSAPIDTDMSVKPVFIRHLLQDLAGDAVKNNIHKHESSIILIDFEYGQKLNDQRPAGADQTGTPIFMARAIQLGTPLPVCRIAAPFPALPKVNSKIRDRYNVCYPERLSSFNGPYKYEIVEGTDDTQKPPPLRQHELRHDGESAAWMLKWWGIQAWPQNGANVPIVMAYWSDLIPWYVPGSSELRDYRDIFLHRLSSKSVIHPDYDALSKLFRNIAETIIYDYHWAKDENRRKPEYVHEALQRLILNFVVEHYDDAFMDLEKREERRKIWGEKGYYLSVSATDARRSCSDGSSASSGGKRDGSGQDNSRENSGSSGDEDEHPLKKPRVV